MDLLQWTAREDVFEEVTFIADARREQTSQGKTDERSGQRNGTCKARGESEQKPVWLGRRERDVEQTEVLKGWQGWLGRLWEVDLKTSGCLVGTKPVSTAICVGNDVKSSQKLPDE